MSYNNKEIENIYDNNYYMFNDIYNHINNIIDSDEEYIEDDFEEEPISISVDDFEGQPIINTNDYWYNEYKKNESNSNCDCSHCWCSKEYSKK